MQKSVQIDEELELKELELLRFDRNQTNLCVIQQHRKIKFAVKLTLLLSTKTKTELWCKMTPTKIQKLMNLVTSFRGRKKCTERELLSLIGSFNFAARGGGPRLDFSLMHDLPQLHC